jgi:hypothetical protein
MKDNGKAILNMVAALIYSQTGMCILETIKMGNLLVMGSIYGVMEQYMLGILSMDWSKDMESGKKEKEITPMHMKELMQMIKNKDMVCSHGLVAMCTKESIWTTKEMEREKWGGQMDQYTLDYGKEESSMGKVKWSFQMGKSKKGYSTTIYTEDHL